MQKRDHNIGFLEKRLFFTENCRKSQEIVEKRRKLSKSAENCRKAQKIVAIKSTPGRFNNSFAAFVFRADAQRGFLDRNRSGPCRRNHPDLRHAQHK
jgi:hypothetical protein